MTLENGLEILTEEEIKYKDSRKKVFQVLNEYKKSTNINWS